MSTRTGNRVLYGDGQTYPAGLTNIPMASYMRITRFQYNDGLKRARENGQQGAGASLGELGDRSGKIGKLFKEATQNTFGGIDRGSSETDKLNANFEKAAIQQLSKLTDKKLKARTKQRQAELDAGDYSNIDFPLRLQDGTILESAESLAELKKRSKETANAVPTIYHLPMPNEFQYSYGAEWGNTFKLGTMARILDDTTGSIGQMLATATIGGTSKIIGDILDQAGKGLDEGSGTDLSGILGKAFKGATDPFGVNSNFADPTNLMGLAGLAPNENAIMMFSRMSMRSFTLSFEFFARDDTETQTIDKIINGFKTGMHPVTTAKGTGGVLGFPDLFLLEPWFGQTDENGEVKDSGIPHPMMPRSKMCALTALQVNSAPSNNFVTTRDGKLPLQTVSMTFNETTALTGNDLETGKF
tara:strand:+ start:430 stop:1674 length:1245 start_codon:yes stop_codon:yes gene_type:complete